ncbi:MAG: class I SAM-dependent methyltransferase [Chloroflexi bacterium]|nr:class I SAM-dependent methyltransferase [Chloroflexota bacterium]
MALFDAAYQGTPPWDIGRPQGILMHLARSGQVQGSVLDVGCGTGENALYLAKQGHDVWGIDASPLAIQKAQEKARARHINVSFQVTDALRLGALGRSFDTVIDSGLFHIFSDEERPVFAESLASCLRPGGTYLMVCFSEHEPGSWGPRRVTQAEIRETFKSGWRVNYIQPAEFETNLEVPRVKAWLASITRL